MLLGSVAGGGAEIRTGELSRAKWLQMDVDLPGALLSPSGCLRARSACTAQWRVELPSLSLRDNYYYCYH